MSKYIVTGGAGFIGSHLTDALIVDGHEVIILDDLSTGKMENVNPKAEFVKGCICDKDLVNKLLQNDGIAGCFHLAAIASVTKSVENWEATHQVNLVGTINILNAVRHAPKQYPVVITSSSAIYGEYKADRLEENVVTHPISPYGADKFACEHQAYIANHLFLVPTTGLRLFNVFGPRQDPSSPYSGVISLFMTKMAANEGVSIYGDGKQTRDFINVKDVVKAFIAAMNADHAGEAYNICTGNPTDINELADICLDVTGSQSTLEHGDARPGDIRDSCGNPAKAEAGLNFKASVDLKDGLAEYFKALE